jgi:3-deoxy-manno-octulosonate cytidylyltransferase (CMP-KDO synthetase)
VIGGRTRRSPLSRGRIRWEAIRSGCLSTFGGVCGAPPPLPSPTRGEGAATPQITLRGLVLTRPLILIPARLASTRLRLKPLADIHGAPMIAHVWRRAVEADLGPVVVAADDESIVEAVRAAGGRAILTRVDHASGTDRIAEALSQIDPERRHDIIVNVQGDLPTIEPEAVRAAAAPLADPAVAIATLATPIRRAEERDNPNVVKAIGTPVGERRLRALYFTRATAPWGDGDLLHHIGLYAYARAALERFVSLPPSALELRERLEQLRALEAGMRIDISLVDVAPLGVDTPEDLAVARERLAPALRGAP